MKLKNKIIAVISAGVIAFNCICISVYASDGISLDNPEIYRELFSLIYEVSQGNKNFSECADDFKYLGSKLGEESVQDILDSYDYATGGYLGLFREILYAIDDTSQSFSDLLSSIMQQNNVQGDMTIDLKGYNGLAVCTTSSGYVIKYWVDYALLYKRESDVIFARCPIVYWEKYDPYGNLVTSGSDGQLSDTYYPPFAGNVYKLYGNWKMQDTTSGDETDVEEAEQPELLPPSIDDITDDQLMDILKDLLEHFNLNYPDLSTIEGLLAAILAKLGTLDSDNDADLLAQIAAAIEGLSVSGGDNSEMMEILTNLQTSIVTGNENNQKYYDLILEYLVPGEVTASQEFLLKCRGLFYSKFAFIDTFKDFFSSLSWETPETISIDIEFDGITSNVNTSVFDDVMPVFRYMLAFFIYASFAVRTFKRMPDIINGGGDE